MKLTYIVAIAVITAIATTLALIPILAESKGKPEVVTVTVYEKEPTLSPAQIIWIARLMACESGLKANAVNPKDLDNTPSYGILQFKPGTYAAYTKLYGLSTSTTYMNPEGQVAIVEQWILRKVPLSHQFPGCTQKLGYPPYTDSQG